MQKCNECSRPFSSKEIKNYLIQKETPTHPLRLVCEQCNTVYKATQNGRMKLLTIVLVLYMLSWSLDDALVTVNPFVISAFRVLILFGIYHNLLPYFYTFKKTE